MALKFSASSIALTCLSIGIPNADIFLAPSSNMVLIKPAFADVRAQQKRTYFRFAPKVLGYLIGMVQVKERFLYSSILVAATMPVISKAPLRKMIGLQFQSSLRNTFRNTIQMIKTKSTKLTHTSTIISYDQ